MAGEILIKEIMKRNVITIKSKDSIKSAAELMSKNKIGSIVVVKDDNPIGMLTDTDMLREIVAKGKDPEKVKVEDIMRRPVITARPEDDIDDIGRKMVRNGIRRMPIVNHKGKLLGIVSDKDMMFIYPNIVEILKERVEMNDSADKIPRPIEEETTTGVCDNCGIFRTSLKYTDEGQWVCDQCDPERTE